jgi:hypothetical protein
VVAVPIETRSYDRSSLTEDTTGLLLLNPLNVDAAPLPASGAEIVRTAENE